MAKNQIDPRPPKRGAPRGNRNAAKLGQDLSFQIYISKLRRSFLEEWFELKFGKRPTEIELREAVRQLANNAIDHAVLEEFERSQPGRISGSSGETF